MENKHEGVSAGIKGRAKERNRGRGEREGGGGKKELEEKSGEIGDMTEK